MLEIRVYLLFPTPCFIHFFSTSYFQVVPDTGLFCFPALQDKTVPLTHEAPGYKGDDSEQLPHHSFQASA